MRKDWTLREAKCPECGHVFRVTMQGETTPRCKAWIKDRMNNPAHQCKLKAVEYGLCRMHTAALEKGQP